MGHSDYHEPPGTPQYLSNTPLKLIITMGKWQTDSRVWHHSHSNLSGLSHVTPLAHRMVLLHTRAYFHLHNLKGATSSDQIYFNPRQIWCNRLPTKHILSFHVATASSTNSLSRGVYIKHQPLIMSNFVTNEVIGNTLRFLFGIGLLVNTDWLSPSM